MGTIVPRGRVRRRGATDEGAAALEFALIVPVLVLLLSGIIAFGFVFAQQLSLGNAARQAARQAAVPSSPSCGTGQAAGNAGTDLTGTAKTDATTVGVTTSDVVVTVKRAATMPSDWSTGTCSGATAKACNGSSPGDNVYVRLQYTSQVPLPFIRPSFDLSVTGAFRCEYTS